MKVVAVVVTYNRLELLKENIEALLGQSVRDFTILVVDNHSTDGTREWLEKNTAEVGDWFGNGNCHNEIKNQIKIYKLCLEENVGGAGGFYYGMRHTFEEMDADVVWIMDDDTIPEKDALEKLLDGYDVLENSGVSVGYLASVVLWKDGSTCKMNQPKFVGDNNRISQATFVSLLIPRNVVEHLGYPMKEYFIWGDDKEYTLRISDRYPCYQVMDSKVIHKTENNEGSSIAKDDIARIDRYFYAYRNDYVTAKKRSKKEIMIYYLGFWLNELRILLYSNEKKRRLSVMRSGRKAGRRMKL